MRRTLLTYFIAAALAAMGQQTYEISFDEERADLAVKTLEERFDLKFSFDPSLLEKYTVTTDIRASNEEELVKKFVSSLPVKHRKAGDVILLIPDKKNQRKTSARSIRGTIYDRKTGQPLALANVQSQGLRTKTDQSGGFSVGRQRDSIQITVSYLGYEPSSMWIKTDLEDVSIHLTPAPDELKPFILDPASRGNTQKSLLSHFSVNPNQIRSLPALGQPDVFKSLQLLPGITATDESTTGLTVRGSAPEQNLVILDGYTIYHMDHFFGLFSTFNPNLINHVDLYKGGYSSEFGRRTSAVVEATTKSSNLEKVSGGVGLNTTSLDGFIEVPIGKKLGIVLGARGSHDGLVSNKIYNQFLEEQRSDIVKAQDPDFNEQFDVQPHFNFFDINSKIRYTPNAKTTIDFSLFVSEDYYEGEYEEEDEWVATQYIDNAYWANSGASLRWQSRWNDRHSSTFLLSGSSYESRSEILLQKEVLRNIIDIFGDEPDTVFHEGFIAAFGVEKQNSIEDVTLSYKSDVNIAPFSKLTVGTEISSYKTNLAIVLEDNQPVVDSVEQESGLISMFGNYQYARGKWQFNAGLRVNNYELMSRSDLEPRLGLRYFITNDLSAGASYSRHSQFVNRITLSPFGNSDQYYWILANGEEHPVMESSQYIAGLKWQRGPLTFDIEGYYKLTDGIAESEFTLFSEFNGIPRDALQDFRPVGDNVSKGIDFFTRYKSTRFSSWISYSLASSINKFQDSHLPPSYYSAYDQRHEINQVNVYKLGGWEFGSTFIYGSGRPYTPPGDISGEEPVYYDLSRLNEERLPAYHRLDLSVKYLHDFDWVKLEAGMTLFNVYNRTNIKSRRFTGQFFSNDGTDQSNDDLLEHVATPIDIELLGATPNFFLNIRF